MGCDPDHPTRGRPADRANEVSVSPFTAVRLPASRSLRAGIVFTSSTVVVITLWLQLQWGGNHLTTVMDDVTQIVAPFFAAACCLVAGLRTRGRRRFAWLMLGASAAVWGMGSGAWAYYEVLRGEAVPYPSLADVGYLSAVPLAGAALVAFFPRGEASVRHLLDGLLVAGGLLALSWVTVMGALFASSSGSTLENALGLAYPIGDVILLTIALSLLRSARGEWRLALVLICFGIFIYSTADSLFTYLTTVGAYGTVNGMDVMWVVAYYLIGIAALVPSGDADSPFDRRWSTVSVVLPYVFVFLALLVAFAVNLRGGLTPFYIWDGRGLLGVLLIRQAITLRENRQLNRHLEERVAERTRELASRERHFRALIQRSTDSTTVLDGDGVITYQSPAIKPFLGYRASEVVGQPFAILVQPEDAVRLQSVISDLATGQERSASLELQLEHRDGTMRVGEATLTNLLGDKDVGGVVVNMRDVTMRIRLREELAHNTVHDGLTGLPNRTLFNERLAHALRKNKRIKSATTVMFIDIDHFKTVNDTKGHAVGDAVLVAAATRIESCVRVSDTVARLGGDEFGIILEGVSERARAVARRVVEAMQAPVHTGQGEVIASVSVGVAAAMPTDDVETLVRHADTAMYQAKARGRNQLALYDPATHAEMLDEMQLQSDLRLALQRDELRVHFQPIVDLIDGSVVGGEALLRWQHPARGLIGAGEFIASAERSGAMKDIGRWVLAEACRLARPWFQEGAPALDWISVNISTVQLTGAALIDDVRAALQTSGLQPHQLVLELTESGLMTAPDRARAFLIAARELGVRIAVDDFGTGYSSLSNLEQLPIDILKVDTSVVNTASARGELSAVAQTILDLSRNLHVQAIAEGIERAEQAQTFMERECRLGQGFLFARPLPPDDFTAFIQKHAPAGADVTLVGSA